MFFGLKFNIATLVFICFLYLGSCGVALEPSSATCSRNDKFFGVAPVTYYKFPSKSEVKSDVNVQEKKKAKMHVKKKGKVAKEETNVKKVELTLAEEITKEIIKNEKKDKKKKRKERKAAQARYLSKEQKYDEEMNEFLDLKRRTTKEDEEKDSEYEQLEDDEIESDKRVNEKKGLQTMMSNEEDPDEESEVEYFDDDIDTNLAAIREEDDLEDEDTVIKTIGIDTSGDDLEDDEDVLKPSRDLDLKEEHFLNTKSKGYKSWGLDEEDFNPDDEVDFNPDEEDDYVEGIDDEEADIALIDSQKTNERLKLLTSSTDDLINSNIESESAENSGEDGNFTDDEDDEYIGASELDHDNSDDDYYIHDTESLDDYDIEV